MSCDALFSDGVVFFGLGIRDTGEDNISSSACASKATGRDIFGPLFRLHP
jgi:hypothetical protein